MKTVAVIGFGFMGKTHVINILKNRNLKLVAIVDKNSKAIEEGLSGESGNFSTGQIDPDLLQDVHRYSTFDDCLQSESLDAVHICVHTSLHYDLAKKALNNGLHVLIEKPFCLDIKQGEELISLAEDKGLILMVAHVLRFVSPYMKLKDWIETEEYGRLGFFSLARFSGIPLWGEWKNKQKDFGSSGGALFDLLIHDIDFALYSIGLPEKINSFYLPGKLSNYDYINALWHYPAHDLNVKIEGGNIFHNNFPFQSYFFGQFEKASVRYSTDFPDSIIVADDVDKKEIPLEITNEAYYDEIEYFANCIAENKKPLKCMPESSLETIKICYKHL
jgi:predicted dehydrogenase